MAGSGKEEENNIDGLISPGKNFFDALNKHFENLFHELETIQSSVQNTQVSMNDLTVLTFFLILLLK